MKKTLLTFSWVILFAAVLQGCHFGTFGSWKNDRIEPKVREEIAVLDKKLFKAIMTQDVAGVKQLLSPTLLEKSGKKVDTIVNTMGGAFKATDYKLLDEYYTKNTSENISNDIPAGKDGGNDYTIKYLALNKEMYVSLMVSTKLPINCLITAVYGKYNDGWKLNILHIGEYNILGKTGPDYYAEALKAYDDGNVVDAVNMISTTGEIATPGGEYFKYNNEAEMKDFYEKVIKEANKQYHLPMVLSQVKTIPEIFSIRPQMVSDFGKQGVYPMVGYKSGVALTDTVALKAENDAIQKVVGTIFKGIDKNKAYILYRAFDQIPDGQNYVKHYGFIQKLK
ncbi:hypothetical protein [Mucilaginibacter agri]|uniref:Uncharacterized protein n=1 Tax=Mucilaginibacter agri TaxID=2695265 RepID=A0A966DSF1_9SPHI|nr:hypothetical protein [Mucilaginibacter agri]NCD70058.1 hypothetical protein [Mucilaginibacter agri]